MSLTDYLLPKTWEHLVTFFDDEISITFKEDDTVAIFDSWGEFDRSINGVVYKELNFYPLPSESIEEAKEFYKDEVSTPELSDFFWKYLNRPPYIVDYFVTEEMLKTTLEEKYVSIAKESLPYIAIEEILTAITLFYNLGGVDVSFYEEETDIYCCRPEDEFVYKTFIELIESVFIVTGTNLEYNDGVGDRISGYCDVGKFYTIDSPYDENTPSIEVIKYILGQTPDYIQAKRTIITWLQKHRPCGITTLKKLTKTLFPED